MTNNHLVAEIVELTQRVADLQSANSRLTEEREAARASVDLLMHEVATLEDRLKASEATVDRLRLHIQQGVEL